MLSCHAIKKLLIQLKGYEYKQTRNLIRGTTEKVRPDFSMKAKLYKRKRAFSTYIHNHESSMSQFTTYIMALPSEQETKPSFGNLTSK